MDQTERRTFFADVLLPVPVPVLFTYRVPATMADEIGSLLRVIVPFGPKKILTGLILKVHEQPPAQYEAKLILELLDHVPLFTDQQVKFFNWMAGYYMCADGDVLNAAMPSGLKLSSESLIQIHPDFNFDDPASSFSEKEWTILNRVRHETISYTDLAKFMQVKSLHAVLKSLTLKEAVLIIEEIREKYQPKREKRIRFRKEFTGKKALEKILNESASRPKQEELILTLLRHLPVLNQPEKNTEGIARTLLLKTGESPSTLKTLIKNGVLEEFEITVPRFEESGEHPDALPVLSPAQQEAKKKILESFAEEKTVLLHGITGSGKTEVYISLLMDALEAGTQALLLLPEIALTTQIVKRLKRVFRNQMGVYHSRFSDNERVEVWSGVASGKIRLVVGVRSSVFLPFDNLGLIVVDEEHDGSYKQDRTPRYHARDSALMLARIHHSKILLGSGTPSAESRYHSKTGTYGLAELRERYGDSKLPEIETVNIGLEKKLKRMNGSFTSVMLEAIRNTLDKNEQVILFQNRRGYAPCIECDDCGFIPQCMNCSVSLTYHQYRHALICHYCGYKENIPKACTSCGSKSLLSPGPGTEKLEEEVKLHFPDVPAQRMDLDTTRSKHGYENIISDFESGKTRILIGTQMVAKGLDFDHVGLVGVFDADRMMYFPDFRSQERTFQTVTQVSGRAGRREKPGKVLIQTYDPENRIYGFLKNHLVTEFIDLQLEDRRKTFYPPYSRLVEITFRHPDKKICVEGATMFASHVRSALTKLNILGPAEPVIGKVRNEYIQTVLVKIPRDLGRLNEIKERLKKAAELISTDKRMSRLKVIFDVDPV
jgi:primosomal protein N' (replication factor Y)